MINPQPTQPARLKLLIIVTKKQEAKWTEPQNAKNIQTAKIVFVVWVSCFIFIVERVIFELLQLLFKRALCEFGVYV